MFGAATGSTSNTPTYYNNVDGLLSSTKWASTLVSYSFTDSFSNDYESGYLNAATHSSSFQTFNSTQRAVVRSWANAYNNVSYLYLYELTGTSDRDATIRIAMSDTPETAYAILPGTYFESGDIFFNRSLYNDPVVGSYSYYTFGHELGHALGLKHGNTTGGVNNVALSADRDSMEFSIMTYRSYVGAPDNAVYNASGSYAQSLMMYDISAIQQMYGAWFGDNASDTTYSFSTTTGEMFVNGVGQGTPLTNTIFRTIWDGNGTDTYDFSNYITNLWVDLTPGSWSDLDTSSNFQAANLGNGNYARGEVFNALQYNGDTRSLIENATGGSGYDVIVGNSANNLLRGNGGNDYIAGLDGNDIIYGDAGADTMVGGAGNDIYVLDNASDYVSETSALATEIDTVYAGVDYGLVVNVEQLVLYGTSATYGIGNDLNNFIMGSSNANVLSGGWGTDSLMGSYGNDYLIGGYGTDYFYFSNSYEGGDTIGDFAVGSDKIAISAAGFGGNLVAGYGVDVSQFLTVTAGASATTSSQRFIYNATIGALFFDADGYGASAAVWIASLSYNPYLTATDIVII
jgi:serralysin